MSETLRCSWSKAANAIFFEAHRISTNAAGLCDETGDVCTAAIRFSSARAAYLGGVSVFLKGECESCGTGIDEPAHELIKERNQNNFAPGNRFDECGCDLNYVPMQTNIITHHLDYCRSYFY